MRLLGCSEYFRVLLCGCWVVLKGFRVLLCGCWVVLSILECCYVVAGLF